MNRLAVLAHPRLCEDLARLIVEMMVPDDELDILREELARHPSPGSFGCLYWFDSLEEAYWFRDEARRTIAANIEFRVKEIDGGVMCDVWRHTL